MRPEEVPLNQEVLRPRREALVRCKRQARGVVFEDFSVNRGLDRRRELKRSRDLDQQATNRYHDPHGVTQTLVLTHTSAQRYLFLKLRFPKERTSSKRDDETRARSDAVWTRIWFLAIEASEVTINEYVQLQRSGRTNNQTFVGCPVQVSNDHLDCCRVTLFRRVIEPCNLTDGKGDVRTSVRRQVKKHADDRWITPSFDHGIAIRIRSETLGRSGDPVRIAISHAGSFDNLLDQSLLRESDSSGDWILLKLDPEEFGEAAFARQSEVRFLESFQE
jgi:hypothetical protein